MGADKTQYKCVGTYVSPGDEHTVFAFKVRDHIFSQVNDICLRCETGKYSANVNDAVPVPELPTEVTGG